MNRKGISPMIATVLLIAFALVIGTATMNWGKAYKPEPTTLLPEDFKYLIVLNPAQIDTPLKQLQIEFIQGEITLEEYLQKENELRENNLLNQS